MIKDYFESLRQPLTTYTLYPVLVQLHCKLSSLASIYTAVLGVVFFYLHFQGDIASCFLLFTFMHFFRSCILLATVVKRCRKLSSFNCSYRVKLRVVFSMLYLQFLLSIVFFFLHLLDTILLCYSILCYQGTKLFFCLFLFQHLCSITERFLWFCGYNLVFVVF